MASFYITLSFQCFRWAFHTNEHVCSWYNRRGKHPSPHKIDLSRSWWGKKSFSFLPFVHLRMGLSKQLGPKNSKICVYDLTRALRGIMSCNLSLQLPYYYFLQDCYTLIFCVPSLFLNLKSFVVWIVFFPSKLQNLLD